MICDKPLGQESQDMDFRLCLEHRKCLLCSLALKPVEVHTAILEMMEIRESSPITERIQEKELLQTLIKHARCTMLDKPSAAHDPTVAVKQSYLNHLNNCRLLCDVDTTLSIETNQKQGELATSRHFVQLTFEEQLIFIAKMEAVIEKALELTKTNPKTIREKLELREKQKAKVAAQQADTSSRPLGKKETDRDEVVLGEFMHRAGLQDRKTAKQFLRNRDNAINALVSMGVDKTVATLKVDEDLVKQGRLKPAQQD